MSDYTIDSIDWLLDLEPISANAICLDDAQCDRALALSDRVADEQTRWSSYLTALALIGFEQWLQQSSSDIALNQEQCSILQPPAVDAASAVCNLRANGFRLCLVATDPLLDDTIAVPSPAIDSPDLTAHFFIAIELHEEQAQVIPWGFLRSDQLRRYQQSAPLQVQHDGAYHLPLQWFEPNLDRLLLHLSCLDPTAMPLPAVAPTVGASDSTVATVPWHQVLVQPVINTGVWLRQQWDDLTQELAWVMLPPIEFADALSSPMRAATTDALRSPAEEFTTLLTTLERGGMSIPMHAQGAYRELSLGDLALRLYTVIAPLTDAQSPEWFLLLILRTQNGTELPQGIRLQVTDLTQVLDQQTVAPHTAADYLFTRVIGTWDEQFLVTIGLQDGPSLTLPPFAFREG